MTSSWAWGSWVSLVRHPSKTIQIPRRVSLCPAASALLFTAFLFINFQIKPLDNNTNNDDDNNDDDDDNNNNNNKELR